MMKWALFVVALSCLAAGTFAECEFNTTTVFAVCNPYIEENVTSLADSSSTDDEFCLGYEELLNETAICLFTNDSFDACTEEEKNALDTELYSLYYAGCIYHDDCLVDFDEAVSDISTCFNNFNDSLFEALGHIAEETPNFTQACSVFEGGLETVGTCLTDAVDGHWCSDEAIYNLTLFYYHYEEYYNFTCANDLFEEEVFGQCEDAASAFGGVAYCMGEYFYDYEGYSFNDGEEEDIELSEDECDEAYDSFVDTTECIAYVMYEYGCNDNVSDAFLVLLLNVTEEFITVCGDGDLQNLRIETSTASPDVSDGDSGTDSGSDIIKISFVAMVITTLVTMAFNIWKD